MGGTQDQVAGKAKELAGKATGDRRTETEGKVQGAVGKGKQAVRDAAATAEGAARGARASRRSEQR